MVDSREYQFYFVGTPIGNFGEMTYRAVDILKSVDEIWCEDTRHSLPLLKFYDIAKPLQSFHKFSNDSKIELCLQKLKCGKRIAYISDAGMPCISDPGNRLSQMLIENNIEFTVISGACACINALLLSGFSTENFYFVGFLKEKDKSRLEQIERVRELPTTLVFYSSVHDINADLEFLAQSLGGFRKCAVCKEISKMHETVLRGELENVRVDDPRGEYVIIVEGATQNERDPSVELKRLLDSGVDGKEAVKQVAKLCNLQKNVVYQMYIKQK